MAGAYNVLFNLPGTSASSNMQNIAYLDQQRFSFENEFNMTGPSDNITLQIGQWSYNTEPITGTD